MGYTIRQWRIQKRQELRAMKKAFTEMRFGCAYTPIYQDYLDISKILNKMEKGLSIKEWGR